MNVWFRTETLLIQEVIQILGEVQHTAAMMQDWTVAIGICLGSETGIGSGTENGMVGTGTGTGFWEGLEGQRKGTESGRTVLQDSEGQVWVRTWGQGMRQIYQLRCVEFSLQGQLPGHWRTGRRKRQIREAFPQLLPQTVVV